MERERRATAVSYSWGGARVACACLAVPTTCCSTFAYLSIAALLQFGIISNIEKFAFVYIKSCVVIAAAAAAAIAHLIAHAAAQLRDCDADCNCNDANKLTPRP